MDITYLCMDIAHLCMDIALLCMDIAHLWIEGFDTVSCGDHVAPIHQSPTAHVPAHSSRVSSRRF